MLMSPLSHSVLHTSAEDPEKSYSYRAETCMAASEMCPWAHSYINIIDIKTVM